MYRILGFPDRVKVGPYFYGFSIEDAIYDENDDGSQGNRLYGQCRNVDQVIRLQREYRCVGQAIDTVIHECLHAIWWTFHLGGELEEEPAVTNIATGWTQLMMENPDLDRWINRALKSARNQ